MNVTPKETMWVGERLIRPEEELPEEDPLVVERPELFVWPEPSPEPVRRTPALGAKSKKPAGDG